MNALPGVCVLDASVVIKLFVREPGSEKVMSLLWQPNSDPVSVLLVPDLLFVECANILWKKVRRESYPIGIAKRNLAELKELVLSATPSSDLMERALEIACAHGVTAYDACYVALSEAAGAPLMTADRQLAATLSGSPFDVLLLSELGAG
ncbi:MAG: type II toxin-antitoxin system VapC family toxin [Armatimonadota bacterium]